MTKHFRMNSVWACGMTAALAAGSIGVMRAQTMTSVVENASEAKWGPAPPMPNRADRGAGGRSRQGHPHAVA